MINTLGFIFFVMMLIGIIGLAALCWERLFDDNADDKWLDNIKQAMRD